MTITEKVIQHTSTHSLTHRNLLFLAWLPPLYQHKFKFQILLNQNVSHKHVITSQTKEGVWRHNLKVRKAKVKFTLVVSDSMRINGEQQSSQHKTVHAGYERQNYEHVKRQFTTAGHCIIKNITSPCNFVYSSASWPALIGATSWSLSESNGNFGDYCTAARTH